MTGGPGSSGRFRDWNDDGVDDRPDAPDDRAETTSRLPRRPISRPTADEPAPSASYADAEWPTYASGTQPYASGTQPYAAPAQPYSTGAQPYAAPAQPYQPYSTGAQPYSTGAQPYAAPAQPYQPYAAPGQPSIGGQPYATGSQPTEHYRTGSYPTEHYPTEHYPTGGQPTERYGAPAWPDDEPTRALRTRGGQTGAVPLPGPADHPLSYGQDPYQGAPTADGTWQERAGARQPGPDEVPGPWPTRVSGPSAIAAVVLVILVAVVAVVGLPRLLSSSADGDIFDSTSLVHPAQVEGLPKLPEANVTAEDRRAAEQLISAVHAEITTRTSVYARPTGVRLTVVTARPATALPENTRLSLRTGFVSGLEAAGVPVREVAAGKLGGWFGCGQTEQGLTLCLALDAGAVVSISVTSKDASAVSLAQAARTAVEHRTSP